MKVRLPDAYSSSLRLRAKFKQYSQIPDHMLQRGGRVRIELVTPSDRSNDLNGIEGVVRGMWRYQLSDEPQRLKSTATFRLTAGHATDVVIEERSKSEAFDKSVVEALSKLGQDKVQARWLRAHMDDGVRLRVECSQSGKTFADGVKEFIDRENL